MGIVKTSSKNQNMLLTELRVKSNKHGEIISETRLFSTFKSII